MLNRKIKTTHPAHGEPDNVAEAANDVQGGTNVAGAGDGMDAGGRATQGAVAGCAGATDANGISTVVSINQHLNGGKWISLGQHDFAANGTTTQSIELTNQNGRVTADAIKLVYIPAITVPTTQTNVYYIHNDHLGTPRAMTDINKKVVWRWDADPFGNTAANDDPDNDGIKVTMNLRFAGQYFDQESGLHYNYYRYYDPLTGRYVTSDPIGLAGGLNTFGYVGGNPIGAFDLFGLCLCDAAGIADAATARVGEGGWGNPGYRGGLGWMTEYKCNLFVNTVVTESGSTPPLVNNRQAVAGELANPATNIPNWPVVTTGPIKPGDIVAVGHNGTGYTGHTGIVIQDPELGTSTASASSREAKVNITHFGLEPGSTATIRRCECE